MWVIKCGWRPIRRWIATHFVLSQCAVRDLNPEPADSDSSVVVSCRLLWKPLRYNEICDFSPLGACSWLWLVSCTGDPCKKSTD